MKKENENSVYKQYLDLSGLILEYKVSLVTEFMQEKSKDSINQNYPIF